MLQAEFRREGATAEQAAAKTEQAVEKMATGLAFGRLPVPPSARQRCRKPQVTVLYFRSLFEGEEDNATAIPLPPADQPVQLAMFAW